MALLLGGDAYVGIAPSGAPHQRGFGDTPVTLKLRAPDPADGVSLGLEAAWKEPTASEPLGSGRRDDSIKGIAGLDLPAGWHVDANLMATRIGALDAGEGRVQTAWATALSYSLGDTWTLAADLSGTRQRGAPSTLQFMAAASRALNKRVVVDAGVAAGLNRDTPKWTVLAGVTVLVGQVD